jgi:hypothetical protein
LVVQETRLASDQRGDTISATVGRGVVRTTLGATSAGGASCARRFGILVFILTVRGFRKVELKPSLAIRHRGKTIVRGIDESATDGLLGHAVNYDTANRVGLLFFDLGSLGVSGYAGAEQKGEEDFEEKRLMKVLAHTKSKKN